MALAHSSPNATHSVFTLDETAALELKEDAFKEDAFKKNVFKEGAFKEEPRTRRALSASPSPSPACRNYLPPIPCREDFAEVMHRRHQSSSVVISSIA
jgi:hypothetical protein